MPWTEERVESLKALWGDGLSAGQIAAELGGGITRNGVLGKVFRLGLCGRGQPRTTVQRRRPNRAHLARRATMSVITGAGWPPREVVEPVSKRLTLEQLTSETCKWPFGDPRQPEFCFCGHDALKPLPFCEFHSGIAYQNPAAAREAAQLARTRR